MKLKKIASLMLAGIMAVSMLAGCKTATEPNEPTNPVTPVTGVAATVNGELDKNAKKIQFTDDAVLTGVLTNYYTENNITADTWSAGHSTLVAVGNDDLLAAVRDVLGMKTNDAIDKVSDETTSNKTYCNLYWVNNDFVTKEDALRMVGQMVDGLTLPAEGGVDASSNKPATHDYSYAGSVAAIEAKSEGGTESVWVIAVVIDQTASKK